MADDPALPMVKRTAKETTRAYREAWQAYSDARQSQAQRQAAEMQHARERWVREHHPHRVCELDAGGGDLTAGQGLAREPKSQAPLPRPGMLLHQAKRPSQAMAMAPTANGPARGG